MVHECGTIEFRRPPGVRTSDDAKHWAAIALGFVANAMQLQNWDAVKGTKTHPSTSDLRAAILNGLQALGPHAQGALGPIPDVNEPATIFSPQELASIENKLKHEEGRLGVFC